MKNILILAVMAVMCLPMSAQKPGQKPGGGTPPPEPTKEQFDKWVKEMTEFKHKFMVRELRLSDEQQEPFFKVIDERGEEMMKLSGDVKKETDALREMGERATDADYERVAKVMFDQRAKEGEVDRKMYQDLKKILTPAQLYKYKIAEMKFTRGLMDKHNRLQHGDGPKPQPKPKDKN